MKSRKLTLILFGFLLLWFTCNIVFATSTIQLVPTKTFTIPKNMKLHLGTYWIQSTNTAIHIQKWFVQNWINYTVDAVGTQTIYCPSEPQTVYIDNVKRIQGSGWSYGANEISITSASSQVQISFDLPRIPKSILPTLYLAIGLFSLISIAITLFLFVKLRFDLKTFIAILVAIFALIIGMLIILSFMTIASTV